MDNRAFLLVIALELGVIMGFVVFATRELVAFYHGILKYLDALLAQIEFLRRDLNRKPPRRSDS